MGLLSGLGGTLMLIGAIAMLTGIGVTAQLLSLVQGGVSFNANQPGTGFSSKWFEFIIVGSDPALNAIVTGSVLIIAGLALVVIDRTAS